MPLSDIVYIVDSPLSLLFAIIYLGTLLIGIGLIIEFIVKTISRWNKGEENE